MKGRPWYKRYPADILHGTMALNVAEKGAYNVVLDLMYDRGGPIPDDPKWLARQCGCSSQQWRTLRDALIAHGKLFVTPDRSLSNQRAAVEIAKNQDEAVALSHAGRKGGSAERRDISEKKTPEKTQKPTVFSGLAQKGLFDTEGHQQPIPESNMRHDIPRFVGDISEFPEPFSAKNNNLGPKGLEAYQIPDRKKEEDKKESRKISSLRSDSCDDSCPPLPTAAPAAKRGTRLAPDWKPSKRAWDYCAAHGVEPADALEEFRLYWPAQSGQKAVKADWDLTFMNRALQLAESGRYPLKTPTETAKPKLHPMLRNANRL